jgi:hypothetical protein
LYGISLLGGAGGFACLNLLFNSPAGETNCPTNDNLQAPGQKLDNLRAFPVINKSGTLRNMFRSGLARPRERFITRVLGSLVKPGKAAVERAELHLLFEQSRGWQKEKLCASILDPVPPWC